LDNLNPNPVQGLSSNNYHSFIGIIFSGLFYSFWGDLPLNKTNTTIKTATIIQFISGRNLGGTQVTYENAKIKNMTNPIRNNKTTLTTVFSI